LRREVRRERPDLIQVHLNGSRFVVAAALLGMRTRPPVVWHEHAGDELIHWFGRVLGGVLIRVQRLLARSLSGVIANSPHTADYCRETLGIASSRIKTLYCPINFDEIRRHAEAALTNLPETIDNHLPVIGYVGSLTARKRPETMLDLARESVRRGVDAQIWIVGDGPLAESLRRDVQAADLSGRVVFWGARKEVFPIMRRMHLVVIPSEYETYGLVALEAMTLGKPVIGYDVGGLSRVLRISPLGHPIEKGDEPGLVDKVMTQIRSTAEENDLELHVDPDVMAHWRQFYLGLLGRAEFEPEPG